MAKPGEAKEVIIRRETEPITIGLMCFALVVTLAVNLANYFSGPTISNEELLGLMSELARKQGYTVYKRRAESERWTVEKREEGTFSFTIPQHNCGQIHPDGSTLWGPC